MTMDYERDFPAVQEAYERLGSHKAVAVEFGTNVTSIGECLRRGGIWAERGKGRRKVTTAQVQEAYERLRDPGLVADELGIVRPAVNHILATKLGIRIGKGGNPPQKLPMQEIIQMYGAGLTTVDIARKFEVDPEIIRRRLNRRGIQLRPRGCHKEKNAQWKGKNGKYNRQTYQARKACVEFLGKRLLPGTVIHHMNENTLDNQPDNLWVFPNASCHARYHQRLLSLQRAGLPADANLVALESGGQPLQRIADPNAELPSIVPPNPFDKSGTLDIRQTAS